MLPCAEGVNALAARLQAALAASAACPPAAPLSGSARGSPVPSPGGARLGGGRTGVSDALSARGRCSGPPDDLPAATPRGGTAKAGTEAGSEAYFASPLGLGNNSSAAGMPGGTVRADAGGGAASGGVQIEGCPDPNPEQGQAGSLRRVGARLGAAASLPGKPPPAVAALQPASIDAALAAVRPGFYINKGCMRLAERLCRGLPHTSVGRCFSLGCHVMLLAHMHEQR